MSNVAIYRKPMVYDIKYTEPVSSIMWHSTYRNKMRGSFVRLVCFEKVMGCTEIELGTLNSSPSPYPPVPAKILLIVAGTDANPHLLGIYTCI